jgi:very-short-patch-repair endonuclease
MRKFDDPKYLQKEYVEAGRGTSDIAKEHKVHPNTIRRALMKHGFKLRSRADAQIKAYERNGSSLAGRERTPEEKAAIANGLKQFWDGVAPEVANEIKSTRSAAAIERWDSKTDEERMSTIKRMHGGSRAKMNSGSKNENLVAKLLQEAGLTIQQRNRDYTPGGQFEIDIVLPAKKVAIEWDGATHFQPIYGDDHLEVVKAKDRAKDAILLAAGWHVIRCRDHSSSPSLAFCRRAVEQILAVLPTLTSGPRRVTILDAK